MSGFFHGVKNVALPAAGGTIAVNNSCVIGLVSVSPVGPTQQLILCNNYADDQQFGEDTPDNYLAKTLRIIRDTLKGASTKGSDGSCPIVVVNVFNDTNHKISWEQDVEVLGEDGKVALGQTIIGDLVDVAISTIIEDVETPVSVSAGGAYVYGTDYTIDRWGNFKDITGTYIGTNLTFGGAAFSLDEVTAADIVGTVSGSTLTGSKLLDKCATQFGFKPKILICPFYGTETAVASAMETLAGKYRGVWLSDARKTTDKTAALALRGSGIWNTAKPQTMPVWPWMKSYDPWLDANEGYPYSAYVAGMFVANDNNVGYWDSVSNRQIPNITGPEFEITTGFEDENSDAQLLNAQGIMTYLAGFGLGYRTWGNRNASFPSDNSVLTFHNVYRTDGMISDAMTAAGLKHVDRGINTVLIDLIKTEGNNFISSLIQLGALLPGSNISYKKTDNSASDLAAGKIKFRRTYMVPTPAEELTFYTILDITLFNNI